MTFRIKSLGRLIIACWVALLVIGNLQAQNTGINEDGTPPNVNSILDVRSSSKGVLLPRMSSFTRAGLTLGATDKGMTVYDIDIDRYCFWDGNLWRVIGVAGSLEDADGDTRIRAYCRGARKYWTAIQSFHGYFSTRKSLCVRPPSQ